MAIFLGACSGVVRGKETVRTPSVIDALMSSGCDHSQRAGGTASTTPQLTLIPCGRGNERENLPKRRSRTE